MDLASASVSKKRKCSYNPRHVSGMQRQSSQALSPKPWAPQFAINLHPYGTRHNVDWNQAQWIDAQPPYTPPYGKWIRAPSRNSFMAAAMGHDQPPYDRNLPPILMPVKPKYWADWSVPYGPPPPLAPLPPPPPYVSRSAAPPKFVPASQRRGPHTWGNMPSDHTWGNMPSDHTWGNMPSDHTWGFDHTYNRQFSHTYTWCNELSDAISMYGCRGKRLMKAAIFKNFTTSPQNIKSVRKFWIRRSVPPDLLEGESLGITWVAVRGMDSMCLVTQNSDLVHLGPKVGSLEEICGTKDFLQSFWNVLVSEVEDIEGPSGEEFNDCSSVEPFGVVCVISGNNEIQKLSGSEASSVEYDADKAIKFLQEEIKTDSAFTFDKTVMTAISAFQHLYCQKFEADEIRVFAWKKGNVIGEELQQEREDPDVEELLASLNGPGFWNRQSNSGGNGRVSSGDKKYNAIHSFCGYSSSPLIFR